MNRGFDVAVVGAGIVGLGAGYAAVRRGGAWSSSNARPIPSAPPCATSGTSASARRPDSPASTPTRRAPCGCASPATRDSGCASRAPSSSPATRTSSPCSKRRPAPAESTSSRRPAALETRASVRPGVAVAGAWVRPDLQTHPRTAAAAIRAHLETLGVEFRTRTAVGAVETGRVHTTRGPIDAGLVVVAVNHDLDQLLPDLAEAVGVVRCGLDMLRVRGGAASVSAPLLTGWSLVRYGRFARRCPRRQPCGSACTPSVPTSRRSTFNQMYTQLPDGSMIVGDTHYKGVGIAPFQPEAAADLLLEEFEALFGARPSVLERWQGVYASGPDDFLVAEPEPGVLALAATTGIGMTTGLGLAETALAPAWRRRRHPHPGRTPP